MCSKATTLVSTIVVDTPYEDAKLRNGEKLLLPFVAGKRVVFDAIVQGLSLPFGVDVEQYTRFQRPMPHFLGGEPAQGPEYIVITIQVVQTSPLYAWLPTLNEQLKKEAAKHVAEDVFREWNNIYSEDKDGNYRLSARFVMSNSPVLGKLKMLTAGSPAEEGAGYKFLQQQLKAHHRFGKADCCFTIELGNIWTKGVKTGVQLQLRKLCVGTKTCRAFELGSRETEDEELLAMLA